MSRTVKENLIKLSKYSKKDIIEALGNQCGSNFIVANMVSELENKEAHKAIDEHEKAFRAESEAIEAYCAWMDEMCVKYGDGKKVNILALPQEEISRGAKLETALKKATETERKLDKKVNRVLKLEKANV